MLFFLALLNYILYSSLVIARNVKVKKVIAFFFVFFSLLFFLNIEFSKLDDYQTYFNVIGYPVSNTSAKILFTEPYYFETVNYLNNFYPATTAISFFYYANFTFTAVFFVWIGFLKDVSSWKKVLIYSLYYCLFTFILLRNTPSYVLIGFLYYYISQKKYFKVALLSFLTHLSSLPILAFAIFKNKKGDKKLLIYLAIFFIVFNTIINMPALGLYEKLQAYQEESEYGQSLYHKIYFVLIIIFNIVVFRRNKFVVFNYTYMLILTTYFILQMTSTIMGFRFSIYMILYLLLHPDFKFNLRTEKILNFALPVVLLLLFMFNIKTLIKS